MPLHLHLPRRWRSKSRGGIAYLISKAVLVGSMGSPLRRERRRDESESVVQDVPPRISRTMVENLAGLLTHC